MTKGTAYVSYDGHQKLCFQDESWQAGVDRAYKRHERWARHWVRRDQTKREVYDVVEQHFPRYQVEGGGFIEGETKYYVTCVTNRQISPAQLSCLEFEETFEQWDLDSEHRRPEFLSSHDPGQHVDQSQLKRMADLHYGWVNGLLVHREKYTTFSRHFTMHDVLIKISNLLQPFLHSDDFFVDFSCGKNTFANLLGLDFKSFDIIHPGTEIGDFAWCVSILPHCTNPRTTHNHPLWR